MIELDSRDTLSLLECECYLSFLNQYFDLKKKNNPRFSLQMFVNYSGFSSKAHLSQILSGKKSIGAKSYEKLCHGFRFSTELQSYFTHLIAKDLKLQGLTTLTEQQIYNIKQKLGTVDYDSSVIEQIYSNSHFPLIFSAVGEVGRGHDLEKISLLTGLKKETLEESLQELVSLGVVEFNAKEDTYSPKSLFLQYLSSSGSPFFENYFRQQLGNLIIQSKKEFSSLENLFYSTTFIVKKDQAKRIKQDLIQVLDNFIEKEEDAKHGDHILTLTTGMLGAIEK